jgi:hypothetical protein
MDHDIQEKFTAPHAHKQNSFVFPREVLVVFSGDDLLPLSSGRGVPRWRVALVFSLLGFN